METEEEVWAVIGGEKFYVKHNEEDDARPGPLGGSKSEEGPKDGEKGCA
jgi:hypothetical protein